VTDEDETKKFNNLYELGKYLESLRIMKLLSISTVAHQYKCTRATAIMIERGQKFISEEQLKEILNFYNVVNDIDLDIVHLNSIDDILQNMVHESIFPLRDAVNLHLISFNGERPSSQDEWLNIHRCVESFK
jgi:transcriptional regulator with XRE-family HTH domain